MTNLHRSRLAPVARAAAPIVVTLVAVALMLRFPPTQFGFYPECPIHHAFGILCPGCGATRALAALLHGNIAEALRLNALATLLMPLVFGYAIAAYSLFLRHRPLRLPQPPPTTIYATLGIAVAFTLVRNM